MIRLADAVINVHQDIAALLRLVSAGWSLTMRSATSVVLDIRNERSSPISVFYDLGLSPTFQQKQGRLRADAILITREVQCAGSLRVSRIDVYSSTTSSKNEGHKGLVPILASEGKESVAVRVSADKLVRISGAENGAYLR